MARTNHGNAIEKGNERKKERKRRKEGRSGKIVEDLVADAAAVEHHTVLGVHVEQRQHRQRGRPVFLKGHRCPSQSPLSKSHNDKVAQAGHAHRPFLEGANTKAGGCTSSDLIGRRRHRRAFKGETEGAWRRFRGRNRGPRANLRVKSKVPRRREPAGSEP